MERIINNPLMPNEIIAKRKYGHVTHVMLLTPEGMAPNTGALCGEVPKGSPRRAGWWGCAAHVEVSCPKCVAILKSREVEPATHVCTCMGCGCTDDHACVDEHGVACHWVKVDRAAGTGICSQCAPAWVEKLAEDE